MGAFGAVQKPASMLTQYCQLLGGVAVTNTYAGGLDTAFPQLRGVAGQLSRVEDAFVGMPIGEQDHLAAASILSKTGDRFGSFEPAFGKTGHSA